MDLIIEFIGEFILEGIVELIQNKNISKWIRYPLLFVILIFYIFILGLIGFVAIKGFTENILLGILLLIIEILLIIGVISIIKKSLNKKDN